MKVVVTCPQHFLRTPDGNVWTDGQFPYAFWTRYLSVFDGVRIVGRVREVAAVPEAAQLAGGEGVSFIEVPDYHGPQQYLLRAPQVIAATARAVKNGDAVVLRAPGEIGTWLVRHIRRKPRPYGVEVVSDPFDVFAPKAVEHPFRPFFRWWFCRNLRRECESACAAAYVTERALQNRYPAGEDAFVTHYSSIDLPATAFVEQPRPKSVLNRRARLVFIGTLAQMYKAPDVLIDAVAACARNSVDLELVMIGSGKHLAELQAQAVRLGIGERIHFRGQINSPAAVREELDRADLFVLPSRQEGLPRAIIEAMARALPCVGSTVGGFSELLPEEDLVPPNDSSALAQKIAKVLRNPERMAQMSARNLAKAQEYEAQVLNARRQQFYRHVRTETEAWLAASRN
ncbi:MAG: glycosyltransferase family 4 protein [Verrucomicrobiota bacterium]|nr:glycosyltransferase family 4 protein [Verrucomicrobiota bacterium]